MNAESGEVVMPFSERDSARLARVEEKSSNIETWTREHAKEDSERFERTFNYVKGRFDKMDDKLDALWDEKNNRDGAKQTKGTTAALMGWSLNAIIAAFTAWATFRLIGK